MKTTPKFTRRPFYSGIFLAVSFVWCEILFRLWTASPLGADLLPPVLFGAGFGCLLGLVCMLPGAKGEKILTAGAGLIGALFYIVEFLVDAFFHSFMPIGMLLNSAGGVVTGFLGDAVTLVLRNWWRILLFLLPELLYCLCCRGKPRGWKRGLKMAAACAAALCLGAGACWYVRGNLSIFTTAYSFTSAVRINGLPMALVQESTYGFLGSRMLPTPSAAEVVPPTLPTEEPAQTAPTEPEKVYAPHTLGLDFASLPGYTSIQAINQYVAAQPMGMENEYTGLFAGKNLILITAEAFTAQVIDPELTPTLYRLANEGIRFTNYYQPLWGGSTTGGEMANLVGLVPNISTGMGVLADQLPFITMGHQLQKQGYFSRAYHNNDMYFYSRDYSHYKLGYEKFIGYQGMMDVVQGVWPQSDLEMMEFSVKEYIDQQPFSIYYMTVSGHSMYIHDMNAMSRKNYSLVEHLPYSEPVKCYLAANLEFEFAMEYLVEQLEQAGIADDTVIVITSDHYPYGLDDKNFPASDQGALAQLFGVSPEEMTPVIRDQSSLIIWSGCIEGQNLQVDSPVCSLDILPTISNLFGTEYDSRLMVGRDVFSDSPGLVLWPNQSWLTEAGYYDFSTDTFTPAQGYTYDETYVSQISRIVQGKIAYSRQVQETGYLRYLSNLMEAE